MLLAVLVVYGGRAQADITSDRAGSIIIFPKVIADGTRDTIIQITNTGNTPAFAHCFYISEYDAVADSCHPLDFDIRLTKQQPTVWLASVGRTASFADGFPPGMGNSGSAVVPPLTFSLLVHQLMCVQVDIGDVPTTGNQLKGEAIIYNVETPQKPYAISEYNAISILAGSAGSNVLDFSLAGSTTTGYNACPDNLIMNHYAQGAVDDFTNGTASTELTLVPCSALIEEDQPVWTVAQFQAWDELERSFSASVRFRCLLNIGLGDSRVAAAFSTSVGTYFKTRIRPASGNVCFTGVSYDGVVDLPDFPHGQLIEGNLCPNGDSNCVGMSGICVPDAGIAQVCHVEGDEICGGGACRMLGCLPSPGLLGVAEEFQTPIGPSGSTGPTASAAVNLFTEGTRPGDVMVLSPSE
jgi:hypothetical protein